MIKGNKIYFGCDWDYSKTTLKHVYMFVNEFKALLPNKVYSKIDNALNSNNKHKAFQELIDEKVIDFDF